MADETVYFTTDGEPFDEFFSLKAKSHLLDERWLGLLAGEAAESYYDNNDGWERGDWSDGVLFTLWRDNGEKLGDFNVVMEMTPSFTAWSHP